MSGPCSTSRGTREGRFIGEFGALGTERGQFRTPHGIARDAAGNFYVADRENFRLQVFDSAGRFLREWPAVHTAGQVGDVAVSASGTVYLSRWNDPDAVVILDPALRKIGRIPYDSTLRHLGHNIAVDGDSVIYLADTGGRRVLKYVKR